MATTMIRRRNIGAPKRADGGFSLIEVVISMAILTVGMISLLGVFGLAMASTQTSQEDMIAKKVADLEGLMKAAQQAVSDQLDRMEAAAANGQAEEPEGGQE